MAKCEKLNNCPFYQGEMKMDSGLGKLYKNKYCEGDKTSCARYMVATQAGSEFVTNSLYPNMLNQAKEIIEKNK